MNKEAFKRLDKYVFSKDPLVKDDWYELLNSFQQELNELQQENQQLHNKINKAIEYINDTLCCIHDEELLDDLLGILKDSDVDE